MKITTVSTMKGGTGKSTVATNLAYFFPFMKRRTLLLDLDPQGNSSSNFGVSDEKGSLYSVCL